MRTYNTKPLNRLDVEEVLVAIMQNMQQLHHHTTHLNISHHMGIFVLNAIII